MIRITPITIKIILAIILILMLVPSVSGCAETQYQRGGETPPPTPAEKLQNQRGGETSPAAPAEKLQILSHTMSRSKTGAFLYIKGTAKNVSSSRLGYAEVKVKFYNAAGTLLDTSSDTITDLDPGETWSFEVMIFDEDQKVASYKIGSEGF